MTVHEEDRLRAVDETGLYGTGPEERFDRITRLACELFDTTLSTISIMGRDCQWIKSAPGLAGSAIPRADTFCDHVVRSSTPVVVEDTTLDPRFATNPYVLGPPGIRFYAGLPLDSPDGQPVGTLCLFDDRPRSLSAQEMATLGELAGWAEAEFNQTVELERAAEIQRALSPDRSALELPGYQLATLCVPSRAVGGDLVDYYLNPDGSLAVSLGDVMGKGVGAAIMMATVRAALRTTNRRLPPAEAVAAAAATLDDELQRSGTIVTLYQARYDLASGRCRFVDAGHGLCVKLLADGSAVDRGDVTGGLPLGVHSGDTWSTFDGQVLPGESVVAFSDGLLDLYPDLDSAFAAVIEVAGRAPDAASVVAHFEERARRAALDDDVAMVVVRRDP